LTVDASSVRSSSSYQLVVDGGSCLQVHDNVINGVLAGVGHQLDHDVVCFIESRSRLAT
jgi:hypothetical protein